MGRTPDTVSLITSLLSGGAPSDQLRRRLPVDERFRVLAVCETGNLEDRFRKVVQALGSDIRFARSFSDGLNVARESLCEIVVVAKADNGMSAREFVREVNRINPETVVILAAPNSEYERLVEAMVEGAYDFLPDSADDNQLRLMVGRAMGHALLRRKSEELERALDAQTASLRQRLLELALLNEMSQDMSSVPDLDETLRRALARMLDAFGSECGSFLMLDTNTNELVVRAAAGRGADRLLGLRRKLGEGISGKVASERHPILVTDLSRDARFRFEALSQSGVRNYRTHSMIAVPLVYHGRLLGEINITEKASGEPFTPDDLRLLSILGGHVASAVNGALAAEELKEANIRLREKMFSTRESLQTAHEELLRSEHLARAIVRSLPSVTATFDPKLTVTSANDAARKLLGLEEGRTLRGPADGPVPPGLADAAEQAVRDGVTRRIACHARQVENAACSTRACLDVAVTPLRISPGAVIGGIIIATPGNCPLLRRDANQEDNP